VARKKVEAEAEGATAEQDAKEAHDDRSSSDAKEPPADAAEGGGEGGDAAFPAVEEANKELVNFQKMELVGTHTTCLLFILYIDYLIY
jgi:hypothetical protein